MTDTTDIASTAVTADANSVTTTNAVRPGYKTTEFWFALLAKVVGGLLVSGLWGDGTPLMRGLGVAAIVLSSLGYTVSRTLVKLAAVLLLLFAFSAPQLGCTTLKDSGKRVAGDVYDCMKPDAKAAIGELAPAFRDIVKNATGDNGRVDWAPVRAVAAPLKSAATRCAFTAVIAEVLRPKTKAGAPQSSSLEADPNDVLTGFEAIRADYFGGAKFELGDQRL